MPSEFTIRDKSTNPKFSLRSSVLESFLSARTESCSLVISKYQQDYFKLTGKKILFDHEQTQLLLSVADADGSRQWESKYADLPSELYGVVSIFTQGFLSSPLSGGLLKDLSIAETFYDLLDLKIDLIKNQKNSHQEVKINGRRPLT